MLAQPYVEKALRIASVTTCAADALSVTRSDKAACASRNNARSGILEVYWKNSHDARGSKSSSIQAGNERKVRRGGSELIGWPIENTIVEISMRREVYRRDLCFWVNEPGRLVCMFNVLRSGRKMFGRR